LNSENWRSLTEFSKLSPKKMKMGKKRIAVVGDSFAFGLGVSDSETFPVQLEKVLGPEYEVMNFAAMGHGFDQMTLTATEIVKDYSPDHLILAFISDDLYRACRNFQFHSRKPVYKKIGNRWELKGVPVATPYETYLEHKDHGGRDFIRAILLRSRVIQAGVELALFSERKRCLEELPSFLFSKVQKDFGVNVSVVHLQGEKPRLEFPFVSLAEETSKAGRTLSDGHPTAELNRIFAERVAPLIKDNPALHREKVSLLPR
jgi:hypothetical protein